jgi:hypothetical protein
VRIALWVATWFAVVFIVATTASACNRRSTDASDTGAPQSRASDMPELNKSTAVARSPATAGPIAVGSVATDRRCTDICERSRLLKCDHPEACKPNCMAMASLTPCSEEFVSFHKCLVGEPPQHWECAEDGVAAIRDGFCEAEQKRAANCMTAKMQP